MRQLLGNPHLRDYLSLLNGKDYPRGLLRNAMQEPLFIEFANACLKAIHPEEAAEEVTDEQIVQKLQETIDQWLLGPAKIKDNTSILSLFY